MSITNACRAFAIATVCFLAGDLSASAAPRPRPSPPQPGCNDSAQNSPAAQQRRCSQNVFNRLYRQVGKYCKERPRACKQTDACGTLTEKISAGYGCTDARELVQQQCYRPGDAGYQGHMAQISEANAAVRKCIDIQTEKCQ